MHRKLIDTLELIIKKKTEEIVNKGQNKNQKAIALNRRRLLFGLIENANYCSPDFVIVSPKSLRQRVLLFSDVLPSALFGCKSPCSEVA